MMRSASKMRKKRWAVPLALQARCDPEHVIVYGMRMLASYAMLRMIPLPL
jgi:hypothetical protein